MYAAPKDFGVRMRRRPKEQIQQREQLDLGDSEEDLLLLSPVQTAHPASDSQKSAPKPKKVREPRKPHVPAWLSEARRREAELAKAYFREVDEFELLEEIVSPGPQVLQDTENVPPQNDGMVESTVHAEDQSCLAMRLTESSTQLYSCSMLPVAPAATPTQACGHESQSCERSILEAPFSEVQPEDDSSSTPVEPASSAHAVSNPIAHWMRHFHRDSEWRCESEEHRASLQSARADHSTGSSSAVGAAAGAHAAATSRDLALPALPDHGRTRSVASYGETGVFHSATDVSLGTPTKSPSPYDVLVTPSEDNREPPASSIVLQQKNSSTRTPGSTAPVVSSTPLGAAAVSQPSESTSATSSQPPSQHNSGLITPLQSTRVTSQQQTQGRTGADRRSIVDVVPDSSVSAPCSPLCTPPNIQAFASGSGTVTSEAIEDCSPRDCCEESMLEEGTPAAVPVSPDLHATVGTAEVRTADKTEAAAQHTGDTPRRAGSQRSTVPSSVHTQHTTASIRSAAAERSSEGNTSLNNGPAGGLSCTPVPYDASPADSAASNRMMKQVLVQFKQNITTRHRPKESGATNGGCSAPPNSCEKVAVRGSDASCTSSQSQGRVEPLMSESTDYGPPPSTVIRGPESTLGMPCPRQHSESALISESTDYGPPVPPSTLAAEALEQHPAAQFSTGLEQATSAGAGQRACDTAGFPSTHQPHSLFSDAGSESQWTLSGINVSQGAQNAQSVFKEVDEQQSRLEGQHSVAANTRHQRMSLALSGRVPQETASAATQSQMHMTTAACPRHLSKPPLVPRAEGDCAPAHLAEAASRGSVAASCATPPDSTTEGRQCSSTANKPLLSSLAASAAPSTVSSRPRSQVSATGCLQQSGTMSQITHACCQENSTCVEVASASRSADRPPGVPAPLSGRTERLRQRLKARASVLLGPGPDRLTPQRGFARKSLIPAPGASSATPATPQHHLHAVQPVIRAGEGDSDSARPSPNPRTALLTSLLQLRAERSSIPQQRFSLEQETDVVNVPRQQTPPQLSESGSSVRHSKGSVATPEEPNTSLCTPANQQPVPSRELSSPGSSVVEVSPKGTPVHAPVLRKACGTRAAVGSAQRPHTATMTGAAPSQLAAIRTSPAHPDVHSAAYWHQQLLELRSGVAQMQVPGTCQAGTPHAVQHDEAFMCMSQSSEDTAVRRPGEPRVSDDDEVLEPLTALEEMLMLCNQNEPLDFKSALNEFTGGKKVEKLNEGSFKEVFQCGGDVIQIMPIEGSTMINEQQQMSAEQALPEITAHAQLSQLQSPTHALHSPEGCTSCCAAYPNTKRTLVVRGKFHTTLVAAWKRFKTKWAHDEDKAQNENPSKLPASQLYVIMVVENGGSDLESFDIKDFKTAKSLILQAALALAVAESCLEFEHRDLHWGNLLINAAPKNTPQVFRLRGKDWSVRSEGIRICLIDFSLSRLLCSSGAVKCSNLASEDLSWLFTQVEEVVNPQTEAYYAMKQQAEQAWRQAAQHQQGWHSFTPCTNVQWILYLAKILRYKRYKKYTDETYKGVSMTRKEQATIDSFMKDIAPASSSEWTASCEKLVEHPFFADMLEA